MDGPASKKAKAENGDCYIPIQLSGANGDGTHDLSLIFSLQEERGKLVKSLVPFQVSPLAAKYEPLDLFPPRHWVLT